MQMQQQPMGYGGQQQMQQPMQMQQQPMGYGGQQQMQPGFQQPMGQQPMYDPNMQQ